MTSRAEEVRKVQFIVDRIADRQAGDHPQRTDVAAVQAALAQVEATLLIVDVLDDLLNLMERGK